MIARRVVGEANEKEVECARRLEKKRERIKDKVKWLSTRFGKRGRRDECCDADREREREREGGQVSGGGVAESN